MMRRAVLAGFAGGLIFVAGRAVAQQPPVLSSHTDYSSDAARRLPIVCKQGDIELAPGKSMGELFGADWPAEPAASVSRQPAKLVQKAKAIWPRGLETVSAVAVVATLVDAGGRPISAHPICVTRNGFDKAAARMAMRSRYAPALIDGKPVTSVIAFPAVFTSWRVLRRGEFEKAD